VLHQALALGVADPLRRANQLEQCLQSSLIPRCQPGQSRLGRPYAQARRGAPAGLTSLRELRLERCEALTSAAPLAELTRLEALSLALCCRLTGVARLSCAPPKPPAPVPAVRSAAPASAPPPHGAAAAQPARPCGASAAPPRALGT